MYLHERENWTDFRWDNAQVSLLLDDVCREQGRLLGRLAGVGFDDQLRAMAENLTYDVVTSSEIEGITLNVSAVRSSIARRLGVESLRESVAPSHYVDAVVAVMLDAMEHYDAPLTRERLCAWQASFFPTGHSEGTGIEVGRYRTHNEHIVSGFLGREKVHYVAPAPERVEAEMERFLHWCNDLSVPLSPILRSAIAHLWFVSIHPFEDGNGRLARILGDIFLARGDHGRMRFYSVSQGINRDKKRYYDILERTEQGDGDITEWLVWYLQTVARALQDANVALTSVLNKSLFWQQAAGIPLNERQTLSLNTFLDGHEAKITTRNWAAMNHCSRDTALRDLQDLLAKGLLSEDQPGAKRPSYSVRIRGHEDTASKFQNVSIIQESGHPYLTAQLDGRPIRERILPLDAARFAQGELPLAHLLMKYCAYLCC